MKVHLLGVPNCPSIDAFSFEPCSQKLRRFPRMLRQIGIDDVIFYGHLKSDVQCEMVETVDDEILERVYGYSSENTEKISSHYLNAEVDDEVHVTVNMNSIRELEQRLEYGDVIVLPGAGYQSLAEHFDENQYALVEMSIGYPHVTVKNFRVFQSHTHMALICGLNGVQVPQPSDAVIPLFMDKDLFDYSEEKEDYCLYMGRLIPNKGIDIVIELSRELGFSLKIAGTGAGGKYLNNDMLQYDEIPDNVEVLGVVEPEERRKLLSKAKVVFSPSLYLEAFGGVVPEAHMSGTPTITTDLGNFCFTNIHGKTGYRCRYFQEFIWAYENIDKISHQDCFDHAMKNYSLETIVPKFARYFNYINEVYNGDGFYSKNFSHEKYFLEGE